MKYVIFFRQAIVVVFMVLSFTTANAQYIQKHKPRWVSEKGYWVIETNGNDRSKKTIHFYNNNNQLVYRENVSGLNVRISKRSVKMKLKKVLEASVAEWQLQEGHPENLALVARIL